MDERESVNMVDFTTRANNSATKVLLYTCGLLLNHSLWTDASADVYDPVHGIFYCVVQRCVAYLSRYNWTALHVEWYDAHTYPRVVTDILRSDHAGSSAYSS